MATFISHSPAETAALGETWGRAADQGLVVGLCGDLGAGKTQLVKGLARGLGIVECVRSPTFVLVNVYASGRLPLFHLDLYRLETQEQIIAAGLEEYLKPEGVTVIEWAERLFGESGRPKVEGRRPEPVISNDPSPVISGSQHFRRVRIEVLGETERRIIYEDSGA